MTQAEFVRFALDQGLEAAQAKAVELFGKGASARELLRSASQSGATPGAQSPAASPSASGNTPSTPSPAPTRPTGHSTADAASFGERDVRPAPTHAVLVDALFDMPRETPSGMRQVLREFNLGFGRSGHYRPTRQERRIAHQKLDYFFGGGTERRLPGTAIDNGKGEREKGFRSAEVILTNQGEPLLILKETKNEGDYPSQTTAYLVDCEAPPAYLELVRRGMTERTTVWRLEQGEKAAERAAVKSRRRNGPDLGPVARVFTSRPNSPAGVALAGFAKLVRDERRVFRKSTTADEWSDHLELIAWRYVQTEYHFPELGPDLEALLEQYSLGDRVKKYISLFEDGAKEQGRWPPPSPLSEADVDRLLKRGFEVG